MHTLSQRGQSESADEKKKDFLTETFELLYKGITISSNLPLDLCENIGLQLEKTSLQFLTPGLILFNRFKIMIPILWYLAENRVFLPERKGTCHQWPVSLHCCCAWDRMGLFTQPHNNRPALVQ